MERVIETEWLDGLPAADAGAIGSRKDLQRLNAWMGSASLLARALQRVLKPELPCRIADLGGGDARLFFEVAQRLGVRPAQSAVTIVDRHNIVSPQTTDALARLGWDLRISQADVFDWLEQQNDREWDVIAANLFLHHFTEAQLARLLQEVGRITRFFVALEPRRSSLALVFSRCVRLIGCNHVTRHDAPASVRAGFSGDELSGLWSADENWAIEERQAGWFGHVFVARRKNLGVIGCTTHCSGRRKESFSVEAPSAKDSLRRPL